MNGPILVFGMPRSGTTWIGKLFDSHPDTLYRHEPDSIHRLGLPLFPEVDTAAQYRRELQQFVGSLPGLRSPEIVGKQPLFPKSYLSRARLVAFHASVVAAKAASQVRRHTPCLYRPTGVGYERVRVVWKSIESLGRLGVCLDALPAARAIHLMRHPCGYVASVLRGRDAHRFIGETLDTDDSWIVRRLLATTTGRRYKARLSDTGKLTHAQQLAWIWMMMHEKTLADIASNERVLTVRYEDVCAEPIAIARKMFAFTGLAWHPQVESFIRASTGVTRQTTDTGYYGVFKPSQVVAERWRSELPPETIESIMGILHEGPLGCKYISNRGALEGILGAVT
ncbi:MAG: sulfotransferase [Gammaproteobacteria bacterium]